VESARGARGLPSNLGVAPEHSLAALALDVSRRTDACQRETRGLSTLMAIRPSSAVDAFAVARLIPDVGRAMGDSAYIALP
jgi:hypothetical protein